MTEDMVPDISILFVDDEENILKSLNRLMRFEPYECDFANSGEEGIEMLKVKAYDIVVSDMRMPKMQGDEFLVKVKAQQPESIRMILSGFSDFQSTINALNKGGIHQFISKPWDDQELLEKINEAASFIKVRKERDLLKVKLAARNKKLREINENLEDAVKARTSELEQTAGMLDITYQQIKTNYHQFIDVIAHVLQLRSLAPSQYLNEVAESAKLLALKIGQSEDYSISVYQAAKLHEIGKMSCSDHLLGLPLENMNAQEFRQYRDYPMVGYSILASVDNLSDSAAFIKNHCEKWDGTGYPEKLKGEAIPLGARILALAIFFYMYRHGAITGSSMSPNETIEIIRHQAGRQFDPNLVEVFFDVVTEIENRAGEGERKVKIEDIQPGMMLSRDLFSVRGFILLTKGTKLSERTIAKLKLISMREETQYQLFVRQNVF